ncbi:MAG: M6 family metalloprotease-like protein [Candidatus Krumholzibacteriia bacterium]
MRYHLLVSTIFLFLLGGDFTQAAAQNEDQSRLHELRKERREAARSKNLAKSKADAAAPFALLVIPVDFSDSRLPSDWNNTDLSNRLNLTSGESLRNYFDVASFGNVDLQVTMAPLVRLPDTRRLYSDRDLNGNSRTRKLARDAITAARDFGLIFRALDNDGADGRPGTEDDDGMVDGVLILHAAPGTENDPADGLIQALQFYLDDPVVHQGVAASFYAVASMQSGTGIWAHETAHLMGMEDRYDRTLPTSGASESFSRGGLGKFSLMSSGAWGVNLGNGAALPDGYSAAQLGWVTVRDLTNNSGELQTLLPGEVGRLWSRGNVADEFYILETRDAIQTAPFDAAIPSGQLMITHIDERLPEGGVSEDGNGVWHLRARLVEADNDRRLATGDDDGRDEDLFPGPLSANEFGPQTTPSSTSYFDGPTGVSIGQITPGDGQVQFTVSLDTGQSVTFDYGFESDSGLLELQAQSTGQPISSLRCLMTATSVPAYGTFMATGTTTVDINFVKSSTGVWLPEQPNVWNLDAGITESDRTRFQFQWIAEAGTIDIQARWWTWLSLGEALDFRAAWPGSWTVAHPSNNTDTTWLRWTGAPWLTTNQEAVLACVNAQHSTSAEWPNVAYANRAYTTLTSAAMSSQVMGIRLTHSISIDRTDTVLPRDGGLVVWVGPDGREHPATPLEGYGYRIDRISNMPLHGEDAFADPELPLTANLPTWRTDAFLIPSGLAGPWQLRFKFASDGLWRARGWYIADIEPLMAPNAEERFVPAWTTELRWFWPWADGLPVDFDLETRTDDDALWQPIAVDISATSEPQVFVASGSQILSALAGGAGQRQQVRVVGQRPAGGVASQAVVIYPDGGQTSSSNLSAPWPNPSPGPVSFTLEIGGGQSGQLKIYDLRGRLIAGSQYGPGQHLAVWDGRSDSGAVAPSGVYIFRLEGSGPVLTRKVVLIH